jgi:hypothetical protein
MKGTLCLRAAFCLLLPLIFSLCRETTTFRPEPAGLRIHIRDRGDIVKNDFILSPENIKRFTADSIQIRDHRTQEIQTWAAIPLDTLIAAVTGTASSAIGSMHIISPDGYHCSLSGSLLKNAIPFSYYIYAAGKDTAGICASKIIFLRMKRLYWVDDPSLMTLTVFDTLPGPLRIRFGYMEQDSLIRPSLETPSGMNLHILLNRYFPAAQTIRFLTSDGILREYPVDVTSETYFLNQEYSGCWELTGDAIHYGLQLRQIFFLASDTEGLFMKIPSPGEKRLFMDLVWDPDMAPFMNKGCRLVEILKNGGSRPHPYCTGKDDQADFFDRLFGELFKGSDVCFICLEKSGEEDQTD